MARLLAELMTELLPAPPLSAGHRCQRARVLAERLCVPRRGVLVFDTALAATGRHCCG